MSETLTQAPAEPGALLEPARRSGIPPTAVLLVLALSAFSIVVMQTMVMPIMAGQAAALGVSTADVSWIVTVNLLSAAVFTPLLGSLGDSLGRKRVLMVTLGFVTLGSLLVAGSSTFAPVLVGRALQGMGFAAMPLAIGIVRSIFPPERVPSSLSLLSSLTGIGAGAGLLIAGGLANMGVTPQVMFLMAAGGTALGLLGVAVLIRLPQQAKPFHIDVWGIGTLGGGLACLVLAINRGPTWGWGSVAVIGLFVAALVLLVSCYFVERRVRQPLLDMTMMRRPVVLGTNVTAFLVGAGMYGAFILIIQFVQTPSRYGYGFGTDALGAGLTLLPLTTGTLLASRTVSVLVRRVGPKWPMVIGTVVAAATFAFLLFFHTQHWHFYVASGLLGLGLGLVMGAMPTLLNAGVEPERTSVANSVNQTLRSVGGSVGTAVASAILAAGVVHGTSVPALAAYPTAFAVSGGICLIAIVAAVALPYRHRVSGG